MIAPPAPPPASSISLTMLAGWNDENHLAAFNAFADSCRIARGRAAEMQCAEAMHIRQTSRPVPPSLARAFLENGFVAVPARTDDGGPGLLTS